MPLGTGYFYDRHRRRYLRIREHASDAVAHPARFRARAVAHLDPVRDREVIVRQVAAQGFIRVRLWKAHLGWEFHGDPEVAVAILRRFIARHCLGPVVVVQLTDFATNTALIRSVATILARRTASALGFPTAQRSRP